MELKDNYLEVLPRKLNHYEILPENEGYFGEIDGFQGVWANGKNLEECRKQLQGVLEEWILLSLKIGHYIPNIGNIDLNQIQEVV